MYIVSPITINTEKTEPITIPTFEDCILDAIVDKFDEDSRDGDTIGWDVGEMLVIRRDECDTDAYLRAVTLFCAAIISRFWVNKPVDTDAINEFINVVDDVVELWIS